MSKNLNYQIFLEFGSAQADAWGFIHSPFYFEELAKMLRPLFTQSGSRPQVTEPGLEVFFQRPIKPGQKVEIKVEPTPLPSGSIVDLESQKVLSKFKFIQPSQDQVIKDPLLGDPEWATWETTENLRGQFFTESLGDLIDRVMESRLRLIQEKSGLSLKDFASRKLGFVTTRITIQPGPGFGNFATKDLVKVVSKVLTTQNENTHFKVGFKLMGSKIDEIIAFGTIDITAISLETLKPPPLHSDLIDIFKK